jgi:hypothetical protein
MYTNDNPLVSLQKYCSKLINGIRTLSFKGDTDDFVKLTSIDGEAFDVKFSKTKNTVRDVLDSIESEITRKIKNDFKVDK